MKKTVLLPLLILILLPLPRARAQEAAAVPADKSGAAKDGAPRPATPAPATATGSITGRVVADDGQPLPNVVVYARKSGSGVRPPEAVATGEDGRFRLDNLESGAYQFMANAPGYVLDPAAAAAARSGGSYYRLGDAVTLRLLKGGVVTGTVTDADGDPVVAAFVRAVLVRNADGVAQRDLRWLPWREMTTDDRGVYRLYGLAPGVYVVYSSVNSPNYWPAAGGNAGDAPTYHPSATRDGAAEITVRAGEEVGGVDIRQRGERGHSVSGTVAGLPAQTDFNQGGVMVTLVHAATGSNLAGAWVSGREGEQSFTLGGVADGDYELLAQRQTRSGEAMLAPPLRVSVRGADVTGLQLSLVALSSVRGTVVAEALAEPARASGQCAASGLLPQEVVVTARREVEKDAAAEQGRVRPFRRADSAPDEAGDFTLLNLEAGRYRVEARALDPDWYLRAVEIHAAASATPPAKPGTPTRATARAASAARTAPLEALDLKAGQQLTGLRLVLAQGAAALSGRVAPAEDGAPAQAGARVHLVPAERDRAEDPLRYAEAPVQTDGAFAFNGLAPGRYWLLLRPAADEAAPATAATAERTAAYDTTTRARLRRDAEAAGLSVELQPCQRLNDFKLRPAK